MSTAATPQYHRTKMPVGYGGNAGNMILVPGAGEIVKPSFKDGPGQETVARILPGLNPNDPTQVEPWRFSRNPDDFGMWYITISCVMSIGEQKDAARSWVTHSPFDNGYDMAANPAMMLYRAVDSAIKQKNERPGWASTLKGNSGESAPLSRPKDCILCPVLLFKHNGKDLSPPKGYAEGDKQPYLLLTPSGRGALVSAMNEERKDVTFGPEVINEAYVNGDPVSLRGGQFAVFYKLGFDPRQQAQGQAPAPVQMTTSRRADPGDRQGGAMLERGFGCFLTPRLPNGTTADLTPYEAWVRGRLKPMTNIIHVPSNEEQVQYLCNSFPTMPDLLVYAFDAMYGHCLPEQTRRVGLERLGRGSPVAVGGYAAAWNQAQQAAPGYPPAYAPPDPYQQGGYGPPPASAPLPPAPPAYGPAPGYSPPPAPGYGPPPNGAAPAYGGPPPGAPGYGAPPSYVPPPQPAYVPPPAAPAYAPPPPAYGPPPQPAYGPPAAPAYAPPPPAYGPPPPAYAPPAYAPPPVAPSYAPPPAAPAYAPPPAEAGPPAGPPAYSAPPQYVPPAAAPAPAAGPPPGGYGGPAAALPPGPGNPVAPPGYAVAPTSDAQHALAVARQQVQARQTQAGAYAAGNPAPPPQ